MEVEVTIVVCKSHHPNIGVQKQLRDVDLGYGLPGEWNDGLVGKRRNPAMKNDAKKNCCPTGVENSRDHPDAKIHVRVDGLVWRNLPVDLRVVV